MVISLMLLGATTTLIVLLVCDCILKRLYTKMQNWDTLSWTSYYGSRRVSLDVQEPPGHLQLRTNDEAALQGHLPV